MRSHNKIRMRIQFLFFSRHDFIQVPIHVQMTIQHQDQVPIHVQVTIQDQVPIRVQGHRGVQTVFALGPEPLVESRERFQILMHSLHPPRLKYTV